MASLFTIVKEIEETLSKCFDAETGEILDENALSRLDELDLVKDEKVENCLLYIKNLLAEAKAVGEQKKIYAQREKALCNKADSMTRYVTNLLDGEKFSSDKVTLSYRKSQSVKIVDEEKIPSEFLKMSFSVDKTEVKKALKEGKDVDGAVLETNLNPQIK
ncbi:siphovirus Gp157 family protein [Eubacterium oxidoreducens]|uniref:Virus Gp157 n=1 Tax=Eubacterium oxidoreducens TaxID=1732 RepID=A0A1G6C3U0_EUBOX|nr:siphovirus Gp157 family protein [Eubacterium oxidoreducens]SDB27539.1 virus Gp157 [Eubacterium oxidoreducens]